MSRVMRSPGPLRAHGTRPTMFALAVAVGAALCPATADAQAAAAQHTAAQDTAVPPSQAALRDSLRAAVDRLARLERGTLRAVEAGDSARLTGMDERRTATQTLVDSLLERVVLGTPWGGRELERLRDRYPGSRVLDRYAARRHLQEGEPRDALRLLDRLLARDAGDAGLHVLRGRALEALERENDAWLAYLRAFDLEPAADAPFRALLRIAGPREMIELLEHVRRLRRLAPEVDALRDRETELLQRMGRLEEARAVQDSAGGGRS
ncbi:MAG: hypothetical protein R6U63_12690 [Longimicrobiales bacterium]